MSTSLQTRLTNEPYFLFLLTAILLFIASFFMRRQSLDLHIHDTYFVISTNYFIWTISIIFVLIFGLYKLTDKILWTKGLTWFHFLATIIVFVLLATIGVWHDIIIPPIKRDTTTFQNYFQDQKRDQILALSIAIIFITGQLAFFVNLVGGLFKRRL